MRGDARKARPARYAREMWPSFRRFLIVEGQDQVQPRLQAILCVSRGQKRGAHHAV